MTTVRFRAGKILCPAGLNILKRDPAGFDRRLDGFANWNSSRLAIEADPVFLNWQVVASCQMRMAQMTQGHRHPCDRGAGTAQRNQAQKIEIQMPKPLTETAK